VSDYLANSGFTGCLGCAGIAIGSTAAEISTAALSGAGLYFAIDGIAGYKVDDASATITAAVAQVADSSCMYLICVNASGTVSSVKGEDVLTVDIGVNGSAQLPAAPNGVCPIGAFKMTTVAVTFTAATTDLDASGCTAAYYDYAGGIPSSPQTS
jgi:hypothetical protein